MVSKEKSASKKSISRKIEPEKIKPKKRNRKIKPEETVSRTRQLRRCGQRVPPARIRKEEKSFVHGAEIKTAIRGQKMKKSNVPSADGFQERKMPIASTVVTACSGKKKKEKKKIRRFLVLVIGLCCFRYPACHCSWITEEANTRDEKKDNWKNGNKNRKSAGRWGLLETKTEQESEWRTAYDNSQDVKEPGTMKKMCQWGMRFISRR